MRDFCSGAYTPSSFFNRKTGAHAPVGPRRERVGVGRCGFEAGRVADGRAIPGLRRDVALPVRQNTRQGREGGALPKPLNGNVPSEVSLIDTWNAGLRASGRYGQAISRSSFPLRFSQSGIICAKRLKNDEP
jgi:hypothetical protein